MKEIKLHTVLQITFAREKSAHTNDSSREKAACTANSEVRAMFTTYSVCGTSPWPWWQLDVKTKLKVLMGHSALTHHLFKNKMKVWDRLLQKSRFTQI